MTPLGSRTHAARTQLKDGRSGTRTTREHDSLTPRHVLLPVAELRGEIIAPIKKRYPGR